MRSIHSFKLICFSSDFEVLDLLSSTISKSTIVFFVDLVLNSLDYAQDLVLLLVLLRCVQGWIFQIHVEVQLL